MNLTEVSSTQRFKEVTINENFESIDYSSVYGKRLPVTEGLTWGYWGGRWGGFSVAAGTLTLTNAADNYVVVLRSTGAISVSTASTNWDNTQLYARVYKIPVASGAPTSGLEDHRAGPGGVHGPSATTVSGPSSATDNAITRFDGTTGKLLQNSVVTISDLGDVAGAISLTVGNSVAVALTGANTPADQVHGTTNATTTSMFGRWSNDATPYVFGTAKSRGGSVIGAHGAVNADDELFSIRAFASDGAAFQIAARISIDAVGTISSGIVPGRIRFLTANQASGSSTEALRIDEAQKLLIGPTTALTLGQSNRVQIGGNATVPSGLSISHFAASAIGPSIQLSKSRSASVGTNVIAQSGDSLGDVTWYGADGTNYDAAAQIICEVDGTPGSGTDMPGRIRFLTSPDGTATLTEAMRIDNKQNVVVSTTALATGATDGFLYVPTCAGTPSGTPTTYTGRAPVIVDTTNHRWYFYSGGSWRNAGP